MGSLSAFDKPQQLIDWGNEALKEAKALGKSASAQDMFGVRKEFDPESGCEATKIFLAHGPPISFSRKCTEALNNLRNSFDQSLFAACVAIDKPIKDAHYPWADNPNASLAGRLKGSGKPGKTIPVELWDTIRRHEPYATSPSYPGGNDVIRQLAKIANSKHTVGFTTVPTVFEIGLGEMFIDLVPEGGRFAIPALKWDPVKKEVIVRLTRGNVIHRGQQASVAFYIAFEAAPPIGAMPAQTALSRFATKAQEVLDSFKRRAIELGAV